MKAGTRVMIIKQSKKYNSHIKTKGLCGVVVDPPNEDFPEDAVQVKTVAGEGAVDIDCVIERDYEGRSQSGTQTSKNVKKAEEAINKSKQEG